MEEGGKGRGGEEVKGRGGEEDMGRNGDEVIRWSIFLSEQSY